MTAKCCTEPLNFNIRLIGHSTAYALCTGQRASRCKVQSSDKQAQIVAVDFSGLLQLFPEVALAFTEFLWRGMTPELARALLSPHDELYEHLFNLFAPFALQTFSEEIQQYRYSANTLVCCCKLLQIHLLFMQLCLHLEPILNDQ